MSTSMKRSGHKLLRASAAYKYWDKKGCSYKVLMDKFDLTIGDVRRLTSEGLKAEAKLREPIQQDIMVDVSEFMKPHTIINLKEILKLYYN